jgi:hypothetical protein
MQHEALRKYKQLFLNNKIVVLQKAATHVL